MKKLSAILILIGLILILYPAASCLYYNIKQQEVMEELIKLNEPLFSYPEDVSTHEPQITLTAETTSSPDTSSDNTSEENSASGDLPETAAPKPADNKPKPIGAIKIEKINLFLPILYDCTKANLNRSACQVKGTAAFGEIGNTAIAAHRSHSYGKMFNRLDELDIGDEIILQSTDGNSYTYVVYEKKIVSPDDVSVLNRNKTDRILTLITCDPVYNPVNRLIIHARIN